MMNTHSVSSLLNARTSKSIELFWQEKTIIVELLMNWALVSGLGKFTKSTFLFGHVASKHRVHCGTCCTFV